MLFILFGPDFVNKLLMTSHPFLTFGLLPFPITRLNCDLTVRILLEIVPLAEVTLPFSIGISTP